MTAAPLLRLEVQQEAVGMVAIRCSGELDLSNCEELRDAINWSFTPDLSALRLDLTGLTFFDSVGVKCLLECHQSCVALDVSLEIASSVEVARVLELVGFRAATETRVLPPEPPASAASTDPGTGTAEQPGGN
jgi:anti-anti-sigma factor